MTDLADYQDARTLHADYKQTHCPECGFTQWFKRSTYSGRDYWYCQGCNNHRTHHLEYPCPECDVRMIWQSIGEFHCHNKACEHDITQFNKTNLIDRVSGSSHMVRGMPGMNLKCPICDTREARGNPDGDITCDNCSFYTGQYSGQWFCYAIWKNSPDAIRVNNV